MLTGPRPARYRNGGTYLLFSTLRRGSGIGMEIRWLSGHTGQEARELISLDPEPARVGCHT